MDFLPEYVFSLLHNPYLQNVTSAPLASHLSTFRARYFDPYVVQPLSALLASSTPDLVSILLLAVILLVSLKILDYARRVVVFWVTLALRLVFWGSVLGGAYYAYRFGPERAIKDGAWLVGVMKGVVQDLVVRIASSQGGQQQRGSGYGSLGFGSYASHGRWGHGFAAGDERGHRTR